jgi:hypothetical protein
LTKAGVKKISEVMQTVLRFVPTRVHVASRANVRMSETRRYTNDAIGDVFSGTRYPPPVTNIQHRRPTKGTQCLLPTDPTQIQQWVLQSSSITIFRGSACTFTLPNRRLRFYQLPVITAQGPKLPPGASGAQFDWESKVVAKLSTYEIGQIIHEFRHPSEKGFDLIHKSPTPDKATQQTTGIRIRKAKPGTWSISVCGRTRERGDKGV